MYTFHALSRQIANRSTAKFHAQIPCQAGHMALYARTQAPSPYRQAVEIAYNPCVSKVILDGAFEPAATHAASGAVPRQWRGLASQQV